jgi:hypothetical protein
MRPQPQSGLAPVLNLLCSSRLLRAPGQEAAAARIMQKRQAWITADDDWVIANCDLALYLARVASQDAAVACLERVRARIVAADLPLSFSSYHRLTLARVLAEGGHWSRALAAVSPPGPAHCYADLWPQFVYAEMLWKAGGRNEAHACLQQLLADLERFPGSRMRNKANDLARRL